MNPSQIIEAVLFASDAPLNAEEISRADENLNEDLIEHIIAELNVVYSESGRAFEIRNLAEGYQILTRPELAPYLERFDTVPRSSRLSNPALEALAIIAYRQPIGRIEIEYIRGVSSAGVIRTLIDRGLADIIARGEGIGRPLLYGTTRRFLEHFGFRSLDDLPRPEEMPVILRDRTALKDEFVEESDSSEEVLEEISELGVDDILASDVSSVTEGKDYLDDSEKFQSRGNGANGQSISLKKTEDIE